MTHIDEHRLELFVLEPGALGKAVSEIEAHLAICAGCSQMLERIRSYYSQVEHAFDQQEFSPHTPSESLIRREDRGLDVFTPIRGLQMRPWQKNGRVIRSIVRRHPIASGTGAFAILAACFVASFLLTRGPGDSNPAYAHLNPAQEMLEVYNGEHDQLWTVPVQDVENVLSLERSHGVSYVQVVDLDGDGKREVVSIIRLAGDAREKPELLRVFDYKGGERFRLTMGASNSFHGAIYSEEYRPIAMATTGPMANGSREILVDATNIRSPSVVTRISSTGEVLGEYWHFGALYGLKTFRSQGKEFLLAWGTNDMSDTSGHDNQSFAVIVLLDPARLLGKRESSCTRGFGLRASDAELRYIRLPRSDVEEVLDVPAATVGLTVERDTVLTFSTNFGFEAKGMSTFFWSFTKDLRSLEITPNDIAETEQRRLFAEGKIRRLWTRSYFDSLKSQIEFLR